MKASSPARALSRIRVTISRRSLPVLALALVATRSGAVAPATAQTPRPDDGPEATVRRLLETHAPLPERWRTSLDIDAARVPGLLTASLAGLWRKAIARAPGGQATPMGFNPFTMLPDGPVADLALSVEDARKDAATVLARFSRDGAAHRVAFTLRRGPAGWRVDDAVGLVEGKRWSLRRALSGQKQ